MGNEKKFTPRALTWEEVLTEKLEQTQESLRQAVASIDRLTAECVSPAVPPKQHSASQYRIDELQKRVDFADKEVAYHKETVRCLSEKIDILNREVSVLRSKNMSYEVANSDLHRIVATEKRRSSDLQEKLDRLVHRRDDSVDAALGRLLLRMIRNGVFEVDTGGPSSEHTILRPHGTSRAWCFRKGGPTAEALERSVKGR